MVNKPMAKSHFRTVARPLRATFAAASLLASAHTIALAQQPDAKFKTQAYVPGIKYDDGTVVVVVCTLDRKGRAATLSLEEGSPLASSRYIHGAEILFMENGQTQMNLTAYVSGANTAKLIGVPTKGIITNIRRQAAVACESASVPNQFRCDIEDALGMYKYDPAYYNWLKTPWYRANCVEPGTAPSS
jgi:hypothetical protein